MCAGKNEGEGHEMGVHDGLERTVVRGTAALTRSSLQHQQTFQPFPIIPGEESFLSYQK